MASPSDNDHAHLDSISCNTEVNLQVLTPTQAIRLKTRLIGVDSGKAVILALGKDRQWQLASEFITHGQGVVVRIINAEDPEANIVAFRSKILKLLNSAGQWLIIDYPKQLQSVALRQHSRIPIRVEAAIYSTSSNTDVTGDNVSVKPLSRGHLEDISIKGGAYLGEAIAEASADDEYQLQVNIEHAMETLYVPIQIKNIQPIEQAGLCQYGFCIAESSEDAEQFVQKVILSHLMQ
ncbi:MULTISPECIES: flagellar brake domain-containing protein [Shewanella]|uniref:flagellar brake domain-containing protein n=1 Tax=Shewanella TaxID=22 RepID=UPI00048E3154|nr:MULTISPECIES: PilZ domain-containing protein [Shewanella]QLE87352.1 flagellar brake protein [Shewanella sp. Scap07]